MSHSDLSQAIAQGQWTVADKLVRANPNLASTTTKRPGFFDGKTSATVLPLHEALVGNAPSKFIKTLLMAYPWAVSKVETSYQRLPLHCACRKNADPEVIQMLVEKNAEACLVADKLQRLPIHYALTNGADPAVVKILLEAAPFAAKSCDYAGWTPVHVACNVGAHPELIEKLLQANPEAVLIRTKKGTHIKGCIVDGPDSKRVHELVSATQKQVESSVHLPSLRMNSLRASRMVMV